VRYNLALVDPMMIKVLNQAFWEWIFSTRDDGNHPLTISNGGAAQKVIRPFVLLAGSLQGAGTKDRELTIPAGIDSIFVPADNNLKTSTDDDGPEDQKLIDKANSDDDGAVGIANVRVDGGDILVNRLRAHLFQIDIREKIRGTGNNKHHGAGEEVASTRAAAACHYAIIPTNTLHSGSTIEITGRKISVTYRVA